MSSRSSPLHDCDEGIDPDTEMGQQAECRQKRKRQLKKTTAVSIPKLFMKTQILVADNCIY